MDLVDRIRLRKSTTKREWENPKESIGEQLGTIRSGKYICWRPVGRARDAWNAVRPSIKEYLDNFCKSNSSSVILELYMIGKTEETASPIILICSSDKATRKSIRNIITENGFLEDYAGLGLGDTTELPDRRIVRRMAEGKAVPTEFGQLKNSQHLRTGETTLIYTFQEEKSVIGRKLFAVTKEGKQRRVATGGPILWINGQSYQLTVAHVLEDDDGVEDCCDGSSIPDQCSFDFDSDDSEDATELSVPSIGSRTPDELQSLDSDEDCQGEQSASSQDTENRVKLDINSRIPLMKHDTNTATTNQPRATQTCNAPRKWLEVTPMNTPPREVGKLFLSSNDDSSQRALDYALVELDSNPKEYNTVQVQRYGVERSLKISQVARIGPHDTEIVAWTASNGVVKGRLLAAASYMRLPNQRTFQELFPVRLDAALCEGDCGTAIIDLTTGEFYGHIVAGTPGTGLAYLVPGTSIFEDIMHRVGFELGFVPVTPSVPVTTRSETVSLAMRSDTVPKPLDSGVQSAERRGMDPSHITYFASQRYFDKLSELDKQHREGTADTSANTPSDRFMLPIRETSKATKEPLKGNSKAPRLNLRGLLRRKVRIGVPIQVPIAPFGAPPPMAKKRYTLIELFTNELPSEIQVQILELLNLNDILALRLASRLWYTLITQHENTLARHIVEYDLPRYARDLFPLSERSNIDMHYACGLWHRLRVSAKMASSLTEYIMRDIFLQTTESQRIAFAPKAARMRSRLTPRLFVLFHFFENYRQRCLDFNLENGHGLSREVYTTHPIERDIMQTYDNDTLLHAHEIFPLVLSSFCRRLRPPAYVGRVERSLRGYLKERPSDEITSAIICLGGLSQMQQLWDTKGYNTRRDAVDDWYSSLTNDKEELLQAAAYNARSAKGKRRVVTVFRRRTATPPLDSPTSLEEGDLRSRDPRARLPRSSLSNSRPMGELPPGHANLLLQDLPQLRDIWLTTAEAMILSRGAVDKPQDIKRNQQVMLDLIKEEVVDEPQTSSSPVFLDSTWTNHTAPSC